MRARMIGRELEFAIVKDTVDDWINGHGQVLSIIGEAGIGKSRLVKELIENLRLKIWKVKINLQSLIFNL